MTRTQLADDLAAYLRPLVDKNCSTNIRDRPTHMVVEIELVHPKHGVRVLAYSYEHLDDSSPEALKQEIDDLASVPRWTRRTANLSSSLTRAPSPTRANPSAHSTRLNEGAPLPS